MTNRIVILYFVCITFVACNGKAHTSASKSKGTVGDSIAVVTLQESTDLKTGAQQLDLLLPKLAGKSVALVLNNTSVIGKTHLADTLLSHGIAIKKIFAPEHGFRGTADAGAEVKDGVDVKTGLPLVSLYGANKKPTAEQLKDIDVIVFDIQDVGVRFYTYISTMHYVMEACAENNKKLIILDRPNPNGSYIDGPVLEPEFRSFLGMHTIPLVHGLTVGELAMIINGEGWLKDGIKCEVEVIKLKNWKHTDPYSLKEKPSPNLPNDQAILLYPSLGLFEGTVISVGRGTQTPFQIVGHPDLKGMDFQFTPVSIPGMAKNPPYENKVCYGIDLRNVKAERKLDLQYVLKMYHAFPDKEKFFNDKNFDTHLGTSSLRKQIRDGISEDAIRNSWKPKLEEYKKLRAKYLLYP
jgi:uncharacterized protein YbbC (DUF1343 family)